MDFSVMISHASMDATISFNGSPPQRGEAGFADDAPEGWREPVDAEPMSLERLQAVVWELFKAVSGALQDERESAEDCIRRASAILGVDLPVRISSVAASLPSAARWHLAASPRTHHDYNLPVNPSATIGG